MARALRRAGIDSGTARATERAGHLVRLRVMNEEILRIQKMVAEGKITPEEATELLASVGVDGARTDTPTPPAMPATPVSETSAAVDPESAARVFTLRVIGVIAGAAIAILGPLTAMLKKGEDDYSELAIIFGAVVAIVAIAHKGGRAGGRYVPAVAATGHQDGCNGQTVVCDSGVSDKKRLLATILALLFGVLGAHRFYVGKTGSAILQLFTLGGLGIWAFIDFVIVVFGEFTDAQGKKITAWT